MIEERLLLSDDTWQNMAAYFLRPGCLSPVREFRGGICPYVASAQKAELRRTGSRFRT
jgi:hypothetical protein